MAHTDSVVRLDRLQAISYRSSDDAPSGRRRRFTNALVVVDARAGDSEIRGLGEAQFRGRETGDRTDRSWKFLTEAVQLLHGRTIDCSDRQVALASIATVMAELTGLARKREREQRPKLRLNKRSARRLVKQTVERVGLAESALPFAGTLYGIETALLDVAARKLSLSVAGLLSEAPSPVLAIEPIPAGNTSASDLLDELRARSMDLPPECRSGWTFSESFPIRGQCDGFEPSSGQPATARSVMRSSSAVRCGSGTCGTDPGCCAPWRRWSTAHLAPSA